MQEYPESELVVVNIDFYRKIEENVFYMTSENQKQQIFAESEKHRGFLKESKPKKVK